MKYPIDDAIRAVCHRAEGLCKILANRTVHIVLALECTFRMHDRTLGLSAAWLHQVLRGEVGERWDSAGATILLNDVALAKSLSSESLDDFSHEFFILAAHETIHVVQQGRAASVLNPIEIGLAATALKQRAEEGPRDLDNIEDLTPPFAGHGESFIRLACHVALRCQRLGFDCPVQRLFESQTYQLWRADTFYRPALGDEPERLEHLPLEEILAIPAPPEFREMFARDAANWFEEMNQRRAMLRDETPV